MAFWVKDIEKISEDHPDLVSPNALGQVQAKGETNHGVINETSLEDIIGRESLLKVQKLYLSPEYASLR